MNLHCSFCCHFILERKQRTKSTNEGQIDWQSNVCRESKRMLQSLSELRGMPGIKTNLLHVVERI